MLRHLRFMALLAAALAGAGAPCAAVLSSQAPCAMPGCGDAPYGVLNSPCCCQTTASSVAADFTWIVRGHAPAAGLHHAPVSEVVAPCRIDLAVADGAGDPAASVPLYLLHASLLI